MTMTDLLGDLVLLELSNCWEEGNLLLSPDFYSGIPGPRTFFLPCNMRAQVAVTETTWGPGVLLSPPQPWAMPGVLWEHQPPAVHRLTLGVAWLRYNGQACFRNWVWELRRSPSRFRARRERQTPALTQHSNTLLQMSLLGARAQHDS